ncbi:MAG: FGGY-family carbohydrate kinase, partial [Oscillospiraceae bacterium]|nr:FGGY-family carbohydrate kinase [Oscillospiraceae bacterium]
MKKEQVSHIIKNGEAVLGIELGSTRIKAVLIGKENLPIASGDYNWENRFENGIWTYHLEDVWKGLQTAYKNLAAQVKADYGVPLTKLAAVGFSAMMHGYLVFDKDEKQLTEFRTWRNTITEPAAEKLSALFNFNIPQRWSIAHLYQAMLNQEAHVPQIATLTTLAGYVHWQLTGQKVLGVGEASGVFPIDSTTNFYNADMINKFDALVADRHYGWKLTDILPKVLPAGQHAGTLTPQGAKLLDPTGILQAGALLCPPEGDAGTGMVATNSVAPRTGNVSAGTSIFAMIVLEKPLDKMYPEIDMVTTPTGKPVAMVHCNNCTSDLDAWVHLFAELAVELGNDVAKSKLYDTLYHKALEGDADCGGLLSYNYYSGEPITNLTQGRPLFVRTPNSKFTLANFMRMQLYAALSTLKLGLDILFEQENVKLDKLLGHGGLFKTKDVGQRLMAAATNTSVSVMKTAGEGGAWGIALLAAFTLHKAQYQSLEHYLNTAVFASQTEECVAPDKKDVAGFAAYINRYQT